LVGNFFSQTDFFILIFGQIDKNGQI